MSKRVWGKRIQEDCIDAIVQCSLDFPGQPMESIYGYVSKGNFNVPTRTLRNWHQHYIEWGEPPHETTTKQQRYNKKVQALRRTNVVTDKIVETLRSILDNYPEYYLDEIAEKLGIRTGFYLPIPTIHCVLKVKLQYSLQVCYKSAKQRDEVERRRYKVALRSLVTDPEQVIGLKKIRNLHV